LGDIADGSLNLRLCGGEPLVTNASALAPPASNAYRIADGRAMEEYLYGLFVLCGANSDSFAVSARAETIAGMALIGTNARCPRLPGTWYGTSTLVSWKKAYVPL
jgi:hypothetical protein